MLHRSRVVAVVQLRVRVRLHALELRQALGVRLEALELRGAVRALEVDGGREDLRKRQ